MENVLIAAVGAGFTAFTTIVTHLIQAKTMRRNQAKQSILQLIIEDKVGWDCESQLPENQQQIQEEYDEYHRNGGNGAVTKKVEAYFEWLDRINMEISQNRNNNKKGSYGK